VDDTLIYLPPIETFWPQTMDVYTNTGAFPPAGGNLRISNVACLVTGTFPEGHRGKVATTDSYTHAIICDPLQVEIRDPYKGTGVGLSTTPDYITIPAGSSGGSANWWKVVYSFITTIPGTGQRRVVLVDRWGTPGTWANVP
jgi:hypothetical protein